MQKLVKIVGLCLLAVSLAACDGSKDQPAPTGSNTSATQSGEQTTVLGGKVSFTIPEGLQDQNGSNTSQTSNMAVYADNSAQKMLIVISSSMPGDSLENLISRMESQQKMRDTEMTVLTKKGISAGNQTLQRLDTLIRIDGKRNYSSTLLTQIDQQLLTMQITFPADRQAEGEKAVQTFIDSIKINP